MDTKWKSYSYSRLAKVIAFIIVIGCFTGVITKSVDIALSKDKNVGIVFENSYYNSEKFKEDSNNIITTLTKLTIELKNEEYILNGDSITDERTKGKENLLFDEFRNDLNKYDNSKTYEENSAIFKEVFASEILKINENIIIEDLEEYKSCVEQIKEYKGVLYYTSDGERISTNSTNITKEYFESLPSFMLYDKVKDKVYPEEINENQFYRSIPSNTREISIANGTMYIGFTDEYLNSNIQEWQENKGSVSNSLYQIGGLLLGLIISFIYLIVVIGRKSFEDKEIHLNFVDKLYTEFNLILCFSLMGAWGAILASVGETNITKIIIPVTAFIGTFGLILVLSLFKHLKKGTFIKHTLVYSICHKICGSIREIYNSGNLGVKVVFIIVGYSALLALTYFMFPITIGIVIWIAFKKVKAFNSIKEGLEKVKKGDINHKINISSKGELGALASDINSITEGLNKAVENELKSQRLKTDLITNVSHDIRTPLTSIITYVDLLKREEDKGKVKEYIEIIEQKAYRLKTLTDDLFEASKASSKDIPVNLEEIDVLSLITQGFGELNDKIQELELDFKVNSPSNKVYITADGKLFWRVIENLLSNIFKYALKGSRVYIDIEELGNDVMITIKNISAYELNISSEELMERFKRGDESRSSQGSGLGLSIAKSLVENQNGKFNIEIDGDLFKAIIEMPKSRGHATPGGRLSPSPSYPRG